MIHFSSTARFLGIILMGCPQMVHAANQGAGPSPSSNPLGLKLGDVVYFEKKITPKSLINRRKNLSGKVIKEKNKYPISEISLGQIPYVGKIAHFTSDGSQATVQVDVRNGLVNSSDRVRISVTELVRESAPHSVRSSAFKEGDSVVYSSIWGIKPYEFHGKALRFFENGMVEVKFESKNGKPYLSQYLEYVPAQRLKPETPASQAGNSGNPGPNVVEGEPQKYLALTSVERGLMRPDVSYLSLLDEAVEQRADQACKTMGHKGISSEPKAAPLSEEKVTLLASDQGFSEVLDPFVAPWAFGRKAQFSQMDLLREGVAGGSIFDASLFLLGHGYLTLLGAVSGTLFISPHYLNRPKSIHHSKERVEKGKKIQKRMAFWKDSVPSLTFTELYCADSEAGVLPLIPQRKLGIEEISAAQLRELAQAVQETAPELRDFYEESEGSPSKLKANLDKGKGKARN